jgi:hypothetical protein
MVGEIQLISDGDGLVVIGERSVVKRFLGHVGLLSNAEGLDLAKISTVLESGAEVARTASDMIEQSAMYLKLTPESAKRLKDAGGLMKTKSKGISHAMLGDPGTKSMKWLQVETGPTSLPSNPAVVSGVGGLMSQLALQAEAHELRDLLVRIEEKLDDVRRSQRDAVIAKMYRAAAAIDEAMTIHHLGGDPETLWDKVSGESATILEVQNNALLALGALADKVDGKSHTRDVKKAIHGIEAEVAVQLSILARCFELHDEFRVVELDHVLATAPEKLDGHRLGVAESRKARQARVLERTKRLMEQMDAAGGIASANILLHARAARSIIGSLNATAMIVEEFHAPLGIEANRDALGAMSWVEALRDRQQVQKAGAEVGRTVAKAGGAVAVVAVSAAATKRLPKQGR